MSDAQDTPPDSPGSLLRRGSGPPAGPPLGQDIRPSDAGWHYVGFAEHVLAAGDGFERPPDDRELALVVVDGSVHVEAAGQRYGSVGSRSSPFEGPPPPVLLLAPGSELVVRAETAATVVVADAPAGADGHTRLIRAEDIPVETRGQGRTERRVHHLLPPGEPAGRLILFEVFTPGGNWSSYPPHKHDTEDPPREAYLEELYYYRFERPEGWAFARVYTTDGSLDTSLAPRDRDVVLVPTGYHPVAATPGYDAYYLNVMAGPHRAWHFTLDSDHAWLMDWGPDEAALSRGVTMATDTVIKLASPLLRMATLFPTDYWNDSCNAAELAYAIDNGAVGATSNPTIVGTVMRQELDVWVPRVHAIAAEHPDWTDVQVTWQVIEEMAIRGWKMLEPIYDEHRGRKGRLSIQTNPTLHASTERMLEQARHFHGLAPNVQIKFPATAAGIAAIEQATYEGMTINATVSFTVSQALAVGAAVDRALARREAEGLDTSTMSPTCTIMIGRTDDWVKKSSERDGIILAPEAADWAGIAVFKRAAALYAERGHRARLLAAAYRHHRHWSELIGGDVSMTIPTPWQRLFNASDVEVRDRWHDPVPSELVADLVAHSPEFVKAYEPDGLSIAELDSYGATRRTLRAFVASYWELVGMIDDLLIPDPDVKPRA